MKTTPYPGYEMFNGHLDQLRIGTWYNWTAKCGELCQLLSIDQVFPNGAALVTVLHGTRLYCAGSDQLYLEALLPLENPRVML